MVANQVTVVATPSGGHRLATIDETNSPSSQKHRLDSNGNSLDEEGAREPWVERRHIGSDQRHLVRLRVFESVQFVNVCGDTRFAAIDDAIGEVPQGVRRMATLNATVVMTTKATRQPDKRTKEVLPNRPNREKTFDGADIYFVGI